MQQLLPVPPGGKRNLVSYFYATMLLLSVLFIPLYAQEQVIQGKITDADEKLPLPGVTVNIPSIRAGAVTDKQGNYKITLRTTGKYTLEARSIGYEVFKKDVTVEAGQTITVDIALVPKISLQSDVVVVGYAQQDRKTLTSALTSVQASEIQNVPVAGLDQALQGRASGVQITSNSGTPGGGLTVRVRGTTSINAGNDPLYIVDGVPITSSIPLGNVVDVGGQIVNPIADINPNDIESIEVLKDASATAIYGARAANGVVIITTKRGSAKSEGRAVIKVDAYYGSQTAIADLNRIRSRAEAAPYDATKDGSVDLAIENERKLEFMFEGHRFYDLARTGRALTVLASVPRTNSPGAPARLTVAGRQVMPIPKLEIDANTNLIQNSAYR